MGGAAGLFEPKSMPWSVTLTTAAMGVGSIAFMNLSLSSNSVGSYQALPLDAHEQQYGTDHSTLCVTWQMFKLMVIPTVVVIETYKGTKHYTNKAARRSPWTTAHTYLATSPLHCRSKQCWWSSWVVWGWRQ